MMGVSSVLLVNPGELFASFFCSFQVFLRFYANSKIHLNISFHRDGFPKGCVYDDLIQLISFILTNHCSFGPVRIRLGYIVLPRVCIL